MPPSSARFFQIASLAMAGFAAFVAIGCRLEPPLSRASGEMPHDVYVWQRSWGPGVAAALQNAQPALREFAPLGAEVRFTPDGRTQTARVTIDFEPFARLPHRALVLRVGPYSGPFAEDDRRCRELAALAASLVQTAQRHGAALRELQIDFDCPASKLEGYRLWLRAIRKAVAPVPLCITTLPSWLDRPGFEPLVREAGSFVLQVHSVELPKRETAARLYEPERAKRWVEKAARFGVPFRVALPTYTSEVAFDTAGKVAGVASEGAAPVWPAGLRVYSLRSKAPELARLVREWNADRPAALTGVIWFRLPVETDRMNWRWPTLAAVIEGRDPKCSVRVEVKEHDNVLFDLRLVNDGESEEPLPPVIGLRWKKARPVAADALSGFVLENGENAVRFRPQKADRIRPGEQRAIGWVRLDSKDDLYVEK